MVDNFTLFSQCSILVGSLSDSSEKWVLGDTFIRNFFASFNYTGFTVSLAPTTIPPTIASAPTPTPTPSNSFVLNVTISDYMPNVYLGAGENN